MTFSLRAGTGGEFVLSTRGTLSFSCPGSVSACWASSPSFCFSFFLAISASNSLLIFSCCSRNLFSNFISSSSSFSLLSSVRRLLYSSCSFSSSSYFFLFSQGSQPPGVGDSRITWMDQLRDYQKLIFRLYLTIGGWSFPSLPPINLSFIFFFLSSLLIRYLLL